MRKTGSIAVGLAVSAVLAACSSDEHFQELSGTDTLCIVEEYEADVVAKDCATGQKVVYLPRQFGNEQLPVMFAALNCDLRHGVALTKGAVTCMYRRAVSVDEG